MKVSIITATYNSSRTIADTINSVYSQTYLDIEHIIIDGASKDDTLDIVNSLPNRVVKIISEPDMGIYDAMNKGIRLATGEIVGILNSDDLFCDNEAIKKIVSFFEKDENLDSVYADLYYVENKDTNKIVRKWESGKQQPFKNGWHPAHPAFYIRKKVYENFGLFDLKYKLAADFEIMLRFLEKNKISTIYLKDYLIKMRLGGATNQSLKNILLQNKECIQAFKKNEIKVNTVLYPFYRLLPKLLQYK